MSHAVLGIRPRFAGILWLLGLTAVLAGCEAAELGGSGDLPRVLATTTMIAETAERLGNGCAHVDGLLPVGGDPHVYEPVPRDARLVAASDLVLYNGVGLEAWLDRLVQNAGGTRPIVVVTDGLEPIYGHYEEGRDPDPHLWGDVARYRRYVTNIGEALADLAPDCGSEIERRAADYVAELDALDGWVRERVASIPEETRHLVTSHDAFQYYAEAYGLHVLGSPIGLSTDEQPSARTVARIVSDVRATGVPALFIETTVNPNVIYRIARETGTEVAGELYSDSLGEDGSGAETYVGMIVHNTRTIVRGLGGEDQVFEYGGRVYEGGVR